MDLSILASEINEAKPEDKKCIKKACAYVKKSRFHQCDDSALLVIKEKYALLGVFDGVSGEANASTASETALKTIAEYIEKNFKIKKSEDLENLLQNAVEDANLSINKGGTTATVVLILEDGSYFYANVGDSHVYKFTNNNNRTENKITRLTKDDRDTSSTAIYFAARMVITQSLGYLIKNIDVGKGKLSKGDFIFAISDGIIDNLFVKIDGGILIDTSGKEDLEEMLNECKSTEEFVKVLSEEVKKRMQLKDQVAMDGKVFVPKEDDASIAVLMY